MLVFGAFPKRRAGPAYLALGSVPSEEVAVLVPERVLVSELLPLRAQVGVGLRAVSELVFVVRKTTLAIMALGHQHPVSRRLAISKVRPRMVSRIGKGHGLVPVFSVVRRGLDHRDQLRLVVRVSRQANSRDDHARAFRSIVGRERRRPQCRRHSLRVVARDEAACSGTEQPCLLVRQILVVWSFLRLHTTKRFGHFRRPIRRTLSLDINTGQQPGIRHRAQGGARPRPASCRHPRDVPRRIRNAL